MLFWPFKKSQPKTGPHKQEAAEKYSGPVASTVPLRHGSALGHTRTKTYARQGVSMLKLGGHALSRTCLDTLGELEHRPPVNG
jgi:hypothetical protein